MTQIIYSCILAWMMLLWKRRMLQVHSTNQQPAPTLFFPWFLFFFPPGHFCQNLWSFFKSWVNDQSCCGGRRAIVVCCQTSWFCTQQLPHHLCLCILLISREHHSVASILLPAFSSLPHSLWHPRLFFQCFSFMCDPLLTSGWLVFHAIPPGLSNTSTYLLTVIYLSFFSPIFVLKVAVAAIALSVALHSLLPRSARRE